MSELEFKKIGKGKNAGFAIMDKDGKSLGSIQNKPFADKLGNKIEIRTKKPVPQSIRNQVQNERIKKGLLTAGQIKLAERFNSEKKVVKKMHVKTITEAKKLAAKIFKGVGGSREKGQPIEIQEQLLIRRKRLK